MRDPEAREVPADGWAEAEEGRRRAMRATTPAERLELLEEIVELALAAQELNPRLRPKKDR